MMEKMQSNLFMPPKITTSTMSLAPQPPSFSAIDRLVGARVPSPKEKYVSELYPDFIGSPRPMFWKTVEMPPEPPKPSRTPVTDKVTTFLKKPFEMMRSQQDVDVSGLPIIHPARLFKTTTSVGDGFVDTLALGPKLLEPGITDISKAIKERRTRDIGLQAISGAERVKESFLDPVIKDIPKLAKLAYVTGPGLSYDPTYSFIRKPTQKVEEIKDATMDVVTSPTGLFVGAVGSQLATEYKADPSGFIGKTAGGILAIDVAGKLISAPYSKVMKSAFDVSQSLKTKVGVLEPVYLKQTPAGMVAIKPQTKGISKVAFDEKIKRLGYIKTPQGVVYKDALGREFIPTIIDGRPRAIAITLSKGEAPFGALSVRKAGSELHPYFKNVTDEQKYIDLLKQLKNAKSDAQIKQISQQINNINLRWNKTPPEVFTEQAKRGYGVSFEEQLEYAGRFGPLGTAQRDLYQQFIEVGDKKLLRVGKPAVDPTERSMFFSPFDPKTGQPLLRTSRLMTDEPSLLELFSGRAKLGIKPKSEIFVVKGTKIADVPNYLKKLAEQAKTDPVARSEFARLYPAEQLKVTQQIKPFGFIQSPELEVIAPEGTIVSALKAKSRTFLTSGTKTTSVYELSIPTTKEITRLGLTTTTKKVPSIASTIPFATSTPLVKTYTLDRFFGNLLSPIATTPSRETQRTRESFVVDRVREPTRTTDFVGRERVTTDRKPITEQIRLDTIDRLREPIRITDTSRITDPIRLPDPRIEPRSTDPRRPSDPRIEPRSTDPRRPSDPRIEPRRPTITTTDLITKKYPVFGKDIDKLQKQKQEQAFKIQVRSKGKWTTIPTRRKKNWYAAHNKAMNMVDNYAERSYRLIPTNKKAELKRYNMPMIQHKFYRDSKTKNPQLKDAWIEKSKYAIDSLGELRGITWKGLAALETKQRKK